MVDPIPTVNWRLYFIWEVEPHHNLRRGCGHIKLGNVSGCRGKIKEGVGVAQNSSGVRVEAKVGCENVKVRKCHRVRVRTVEWIDPVDGTATDKKSWEGKNRIILFYLLIILLKYCFYLEHR